MHKLTGIIACAAALIALPCTAAYDPQTELAPGFDQCVTKADGGPIDECLTNAYEFWDKMLNKAYKAAKADCEGDQACLTRLKKAERSFVAYKENMSAFLYEQDGGGGTMQRDNANGFAARVTRLQTLMLTNLTLEELMQSK
ncbi:MAG: lysozyme inhibitor LprI family protein [Succinivibrio sp.]|nr:lysozyme inhibitor LprI family protein [Succinivibrio sp.]